MNQAHVRVLAAVVEAFVAERLGVYPLPSERTSELWIHPCSGQAAIGTPEGPGWVHVAVRFQKGDWELFISGERVAS